MDCVSVLFPWKNHLVASSWNKYPNPITTPTTPNPPWPKALLARRRLALGLATSQALLLRLRQGPQAARAGADDLDGAHTKGRLTWVEYM